MTYNFSHSSTSVVKVLRKQLYRFIFRSKELYEVCTFANCSKAWMILSFEALCTEIEIPSIYIDIHLDCIFRITKTTQNQILKCFLPRAMITIKMLEMQFNVYGYFYFIDILHALLLKPIPRYKWHQFPLFSMRYPLLLFLHFSSTSVLLELWQDHLMYF